MHEKPHKIDGIKRRDNINETETVISCQKNKGPRIKPKVPQVKGDVVLASHPHTMDQFFPHLTYRVNELQTMVINSTSKLL